MVHRIFMSEKPKSSAEISPGSTDAVSAVAKKVDTAAKDTNQAVQNTVGDLPDFREHSTDYTVPEFLTNKPAPKLSGRDMVIGGGVAAAAISPPVGLAALSAVGAYSVLSRIPGLRTVDRMARAGLRGIGSGICSAYNVTTFPLRYVANKGANAVRTVIGRPAHYMYERTMDLLSDLRVALKQKHGIKDEKGELISLPALLVLSAKNLATDLMAAPVKLLNWYGHAFKAHPFWTVGGTVFAAGVLASASPFTTSVSLVTAGISVLQAFATWLSSGSVVAPAAPAAL
jgi:hypothetical protein